MKFTLATIVLTSAVSSLVTVGVLELLRGPASSGSPSLPRASEERDLAQTESADASPFLPDDVEERLTDLEHRVATLELRPTTRRESASTAEEVATPPSEEELRDRVLGWVAEERAARAETEKLAAAQARLEELEFDGRYRAHMLAEEHDLAGWQEKKLVALNLEIARRTHEIEMEIDLTVDEPAEVEARWVEFDEWVDRRERELTAELDPEMYAAIYGDE